MSWAAHRLSSTEMSGLWIGLREGRYTNIVLAIIWLRPFQIASSWHRRAVAPCCRLHARLFGYAGPIYLRDCLHLVCQCHGRRCPSSRAMKEKVHHSCQKRLFLFVQLRVLRPPCSSIGVSRACIDAIRVKSKRTSCRELTCSTRRQF